MGAKKLKDVPVSSPASPAHSRIGASSMHRWAACPGSVKLSEGIPNRSSKYAEEGTEAHELAAYRLTEGCYDRHPSADDEEMLEAVDVYVEYVEKLRKDAQKPTTRHTDCTWIEHKFDISSIHPGLFGTADAVVFDVNTHTLHVIDYKHGAGMAVEVEENEQLMYYGVGALTTLNIPGETIEKVILHIVQPRCPHKNGTIRTWETTPMRLLDFTLDLVEFAKETEKPNAALSPGDHCRFCPAQAICPAIRSKVDESAKEVFACVSGIDTTPLALTPSSVVATSLSDPERLGKLLHWLPVLEGWISGIRSFAMSEAEHGRQIPGWKLVARQGRRKWTDDVAISRFLENEFPQMNREFYKHELKSVSQVEKILHKKQHPKLLPYFSSVSSGNVLVLETDPRAPIVTVDAAGAFESIQVDGSTAVDPFS